ncbi:MAG: NADH-quinone oxidoreductase subunit A [Thermoprotei archaeon]|nr:NADH-quinone oxidoreductase subunit A [Thermoprotei archaeon]
MILETLYEGTVRTLLSIVVLPLLITILTVGLIIFLRIITQGRPDIEVLERFKFLRYEAGNPMKGEARRVLSMQYFGYLVMFLALEPAVILVAVTLLASREALSSILAIYLILILVLSPLLIYGFRESRKIDSWVLD